MHLAGYYLMPHPPIIIPEVGRGEERKIAATAAACLQIAREIKEIAPETIVVITPHGLMFRDAISGTYETSLFGSLARFGAGNVAVTKKIDLEVLDRIAEMAEEGGIPFLKLDERTARRYRRTNELDHGALIPLYFVEKEYRDYKLVHITYGLLSDLDLFRFGNIIRKALETLNRKAVIIASGDLSHRLTKDGPYPYSPRGKEFDATLIGLLEKGDLRGVFKIDGGFAEEAGECGLRSVKIMLGALNTDFTGEVLSYEGPFGVGYGVLRLVPVPDGKDYTSLFAEEKRRKRKTEDDYVRLARESITTYLTRGRTMDVPELPKEMLARRAGVFVSLHKGGNLRGCIGTFLPTRKSVAEEIIHNAIAAATEDPRFPPVRKTELDDLDISVDVLSKPVKARKEELDPKKYGVIVSSGFRRGLLLPDLKGVDTVEKQLKIACEKAGIFGDDFEIEKFTVERHGEK
ncbi:MAG TPA: AmmeMemoRadiSam system protein A [Acholeplasmataceae bacterium]|nr:AmmeMemoRadiSam system protein A [Acholeplasmataceae bacterium]